MNVYVWAAPLVEGSDRIIHTEAFYYGYVFGQNKHLFTFLCAFSVKIFVKFRLCPENFTLVLVKFALHSVAIDKQKSAKIHRKKCKYYCYPNMRP